jgi:uncharacterized protein YfaS (alpha-2-macroglobulin family)
MRPLIAALLLIACAPATGQDDEAEPYFSLTSSRTFAPGEAATVQLSATQVESLDFRLYKLRDPVRFFSQLEELHNFGGRTPQPDRSLTLLERFHAFKRDWRTGMRNTVRKQFTRDHRVRFHELMAPTPDKKGGSKATEYAAAAVLNPQQVVAVWKQPVKQAERWDMQTVPVAAPGKGVYVVEAVHGELRAYTLLMVSDLAMMVKTAPGRVLANVVERSSGVPVAQVPVTMRVDKNDPVSANSNVDGMVELKVSSAKPESVAVIAHRGDDYAVSAPGSYYLGTDPDRHISGYLYTDRPIYRPGHPVHFKGILRNQVGAAYRIPTGREVAAEVKGPDDKSIFRKTLAITAAGTVSADFTVPTGAALGYYSIELKIGEAQLQTGFEVQEYRKPEYEVRVTADKKRVIQGESIPVIIDARYYFGEPVANANVTWVVQRSRYWGPMDDADERDEADEAESGGGEQTEEQTGKLDAEGRLRIQVPTSTWDHDAVLRIQARVMDQANREITGSGYAVATRGSFRVRIDPESYVYPPGSRARFLIQARDYDGKPVQTKVAVEVREYTWPQKDKGRTVFTGDAQTDAQGKASIDVPVPAAGSYRAWARAQTPERRDVSDWAYLWVSGGDWGGQRRERIELVPDKKTYRPGDTAKVLIVTGVKDTSVFFAVEGTELKSTRIIRVNGSTTTVEVPVGMEHQPNFFVTASLIRNGKFYQGSKSVKVPPVERKLNVEVQAGKPQYKPGEPAEYTITARDYQGQPVAAEFSLGVVDEAIYGIQKDMTPDIVRAFYGNTYNRISTDSSLSYYFSGEAGKRRMRLAAIRPRSALAQLKPERLVQPKVRKAFPDTVFWAAHLSTDASGRAKARFEFPDSLTTWRATARGVTTDTRVGSAISKTIVRKNLILRLSTPRFFTEGDEVVISALVQNYLADAKTARVSLEAKGLEIIDDGTRDVRVEARATAKVEWRVKAASPGEAVLLGKALTDEESDALELTLPVNPYGVKLSESKAGTGDAAFDLVIPASASPNSRKIEIAVTPSPAGSIFGALEYLTSFPYGCTEQTMSSFLPNLVVSQALKELNLKSTIDQALLNRKLRAGLDRLYDFQHEDGGWGWWQTDESDVFMTAYVLNGLAQAKAAGQEVRPAALTNAAKWLRAQKPEGDLAAYVAYSLALSGGRDFEPVWNGRGKLSAYGLSFLGLALDAAGDARAAEVAAQVEAKAQSNENEAWWTLDRDPLMNFYSDATPEVTAHALKLLVRRRPESPLIQKAAAWLPAHRNDGLWWNSTKQTAMVVYGLTDYLKRSGELKPDLAVTVEVNGKTVLEKKFTAQDAMSPSLPSIRVAASEANKVRFRATGSGRLYWSARAEYYSADPALTRKGGAKLNVLREYFKLVPEKEGDKILHRLDPLNGPLAPGDTVAVRLTVSGSEWRYLMVEDPIPAGVELIANEDAYPLKERPSWWRSWYTRREFRDDRAALFDTFFPSGQKQFFYLMKVVNPGRYHVSPARVEPMYQPREQSTTEGVWIEVK